MSDLDPAARWRVITRLTNRCGEPEKVRTGRIVLVSVDAKVTENKEITLMSFEQFFEMEVVFDGPIPPPPPFPPTRPPLFWFFF